MRISVTRARHASWGVALLAVGLVSGACSAGVSSSPGAPAVPGASAGSITVSTAATSGLGPFLTGAGGRTLYILTSDSPGATTCAGACASAWPPFTVRTGAPAAAGLGVAGTLGTITRPDGSTQVTHDGMPLYYYSGDTQAGQTNGQGVQGLWYVALAAGNTAAPAASGSSGY